LFISRCLKKSLIVEVCSGMKFLQCQVHGNTSLLIEKCYDFFFVLNIFIFKIIQIEGLDIVVSDLVFEIF